MYKRTVNKVLITQWSLLTIAFFLLLFVSFQFPKKQSVDERRIAPPPLLEHYTFGAKYQMSNVIWIRSLQDFDYCESEIAERTCKGQSWLFKMLQTVTNLDDRFRPAYYYGSLALTIIISDYEGASKMLDKGASLFPKDWQLQYLAAYHAMFEEKDNVKAAERFKQAADHGAPAWLYARATALYTEAGQKDMAKLLYENLKESIKDEKLLQRIEEKISKQK